MSTKIYNGYRVYIGTENSLTRAMKLLDEIRTYMRSAVERTVLQELIREAVGIYDTRTLRAHGLLPAHPSEQDLDSPLYAAYHKYVDNPALMHGQDVGDEFTLTVHHHDSDPENLYLMAFGQTDLFDAEFLGRENFFEFGYWDNTDRPDDVSEEEWHHRDVMWDKLGVYDYPPVVAGLSMKVRSKYEYPSIRFLVEDTDHPVYNKETATSLIPGLKKRTTRLSVDVMTHRKVKEASATGENIWAIAHDALSAISEKTPEGAAVIDEVNAIIKKDVTLDDLGAAPKTASE